MSPKATGLLWSGCARPRKDTDSWREPLISLLGATPLMVRMICSTQLSAGHWVRRGAMEGWGCTQMYTHICTYAHAHTDTHKPFENCQRNHMNLYAQEPDFHTNFHCFSAGFSFRFDCTGGGAQGLAHARQGLPLSYTPGSESPLLIPLGICQHWKPHNGRHP